jgi:PKD repeat protein
MRKLMIIGLLIAAILVTSVSCASSKGVPSQNVAPPLYSTAAPATAAVPRPATSSYASKDASGVAGSGPGYSGEAELNSATSSSSDRMVVRTGNLELVVTDVAASLDNIARIAVDAGGYVVTSRKWKEGERNLGTISIRVLADNYDKTIAALRTLAKSVTSESNSSQDVTEEYTDLDSKVKNLEATEAQLLKIMSTATKTEDILSIQRELTNVRGSIEQAKGRMQYLQKTSSTSLIQIKLNEAMLDLKFVADKVRVDSNETIIFTPTVSGGFPPYSYQWDFGDGDTSVEKSPAHTYGEQGIYSVTLRVTDDKGYSNVVVRNGYVNVIGGWKPGSVAKSAWDGFMTFGRVFVNILIWLAIFSPVWIIIGGVIWWISYRRRKKSKVS